MDRIILEKYGEKFPIELVLGYYPNGSFGIALNSWSEGYAEPWSTLTINLGYELPPYCAYVDTNNNGEDIVDWIIENNLGELTGDYGYSGFCKYPLIKFNKDIIDELIRKNQE